MSDSKPILEIPSNVVVNDSKPLGQEEQTAKKTLVPAPVPTTSPWKKVPKTTVATSATDSHKWPSAEEAKTILKESGVSITTTTTNDGGVVANITPNATVVNGSTLPPVKSTGGKEKWVPIDVSITVGSTSTGSNRKKSNGGNTSNNKKNASKKPNGSNNNRRRSSKKKTSDATTNSAESNKENVLADNGGNLSSNRKKDESNKKSSSETKEQKKPTNTAASKQEDADDKNAPSVEEDISEQSKLQPEGDSNNTINKKNFKKNGSNNAPQQHYNHHYHNGKRSYYNNNNESLNVQNGNFQSNKHFVKPQQQPMYVVPQINATAPFKNSQYIPTNTSNFGGHRFHNGNNGNVRAKYYQRNNNNGNNINGTVNNNTTATNGYRYKNQYTGGSIRQYHNNNHHAHYHRHYSDNHNYQQQNYNGNAFYNHQLFTLPHPYVAVNNVARQIEYYFSVENLSKDFYLRCHFAKDNGYVPISLIAKFYRVVNMSFGGDVKIILGALCEIVRNSENSPVEIATGRQTNIENQADQDILSKYFIRSKDWEKWCIKDDAERVDSVNPVVVEIEKTLSNLDLSEFQIEPPTFEPQTKANEEQEQAQEIIEETPKNDLAEIAA
ncbi:uncharacterized protein SCODWIG_03872 [Saccharomycodes ludwigii]|uniref:HTH La-type RNA-binding domain-containing protein n=1 Tax=Saccharomycodes ludwigii TaxID=36035 RepID=A0A376BD97_9ASCO|nr:hypothetical protein SCDLUD_003842 [Saccharomycodes ludwigii]KAH3899563.1 hypothetical protein SCDLUD_003842 [Saccharomycodes ludwigii]SSD62110.1 uncharacterized protein SCODWIG_03872 [Saccharomycodes ludwigii]